MRLAVDTLVVPSSPSYSSSKLFSSCLSRCGAISTSTGVNRSAQIQSSVLPMMGIAPSTLAPYLRPLCRLLFPRIGSGPFSNVIKYFLPSSVASAMCPLSAPFSFLPTRRYFVLIFLTSLYSWSIVIFSCLATGSSGTIIYWRNPYCTGSVLDDRTRAL